MINNVSTEINYVPTVKLHPNYRLDKVTQQFGVETQTFTATGNNYSVFELPSVAFNLSKSYLSMNFTTPAGGVGIYSQQFKAILTAIKQIQFYDHNSVMLCNINNFDNYTRIILNSDSSIEELANGSPETPLYRNNYAINTPVYGIRPGVGNANLSYIEQTYASSAIGGGPPLVPIDQADNTTRYKIPFSMFKNTIFALNKDLYFDDISFIRIVWNPYTKIGFTNDGTAGGAGTALAANIAVTNLCIYLAVETNDKINSMLKNMLYSSGISTLFDYVHTQNYSLTGANKTFTVKYGPGMGMRLKRIYWSQFYSVPADVSLTYDIENLSGGKLLTFRTFLDKIRLLNYDIDCRGTAGYLDYMVMGDRLKGGAIQNRNIYQYNWFWCESFDGMKFHEHNTNAEEGIDITGKDREYNVVMTTANVAYTYYVYAVTQRMLNIKKNLVTMI